MICFLQRCRSILSSVKLITTVNGIFKAKDRPDFIEIVLCLAVNVVNLIDPEWQYLDRQQ